MSSKSASSPLHSARTSHGIYTLGVTGGIGSGKSYIARLLEERGIPVYDTDSRAKALYDADGELREAMITLCGADLCSFGITGSEGAGIADLRRSLSSGASQCPRASCCASRLCRLA